MHLFWKTKILSTYMVSLLNLPEFFIIKRVKTSQCRNSIGNKEYSYNIEEIEEFFVYWIKKEASAYVILAIS